MTITTRRAFLGLVAGGLVTLAVGCESQQAFEKRRKEAELKREAELKKLDEDMKADAELLAKRNELKAEWEQQRLNGSVLEWKNLNGTKDIKYPVRDLIGNYNGWSVLYDIDSELRLVNSGHRSVIVLEDLGENQERFAEVRGYEGTGFWTEEHYRAVIHLRDSDLESSERFNVRDEKVRNGRYVRYHKRTGIKLGGQK